MIIQRGVINRFEGLDLVDRVPEELWMEIHTIVQEVVTKTIPRKRNARRQSGCLLLLLSHISCVQLCATP